MGRVFRGSWIAGSERPNNQVFFCPFCGEKVRMMPCDPTFPTCPWCLSDMPEADDFETPEELRDAKRGNVANTGKKYSIEPQDNEDKRAKRRKWYAEHKEQQREYQRKYYEEHRAEISANARARYVFEREKRLEYQRKYREEHRDELREAARVSRKADPERFKEYQVKNKGRSMREIEAHIRGVPVEDIPRNGFYFGKGVQRDK